MTRTLSDIIVDEICVWLKASARKEVTEQIALVKETPKLPDVKAVRAKAKKAQQAIKAIQDFDGTISVPVELRIWALRTKARGPDSRADNLQWLCAHAACVLVEKFGISKPVSTQNGNVHAITQLIYEAVTGKPGSDASGLKAVRSALAFREPMSQKS